MTTAKKAIKITSLLSLVFFIFTSCVSNNVGDFPYLSIDGDSGKAVSEYRIVIGSDATAEVIDAARTLCESIEKQTSVLTYTVYDGEYYDSREGTVEVLIGMTARDASRKLLFGMRSKDYTCREIDGSVVIGGKSPEATLLAIERFSSEILPVSDCRRLIPSGGGFDFRGSYPISRLKLNGMELDEYDIVIENTESKNLVDIAYRLRRSIADSTGYWLDVVSSFNYLTSGGVIYVSDTDASQEKGTALITPFSEWTVMLCGADMKGIAASCEYLTELLGSGGSGEYEVTIDKDISVSYRFSSTLISSMALGEILPFDTPREVTALNEYLGGVSSDYLFFGEVSREDGLKIANNFDGYSQIVGENVMYGIADSEYELLFTEEKSGLLIEGYRLCDGEDAFVFVRISGSAEKELSLSLSDFTMPDGYPAVAVVHTLGGERVTFAEEGAFENVIFESSEKDGKKYVFACYTDTDELSVRANNINDTYLYRDLSVSLK